MSKKLEVKYTKLFINNQFVDSASGKTLGVIDPATEEVITQISEGDKADVDSAVKAAAAAFKLGSAWRTTDASGRGRLLNKLADLVERDAGYLAELESYNNGKPLFMAQGDISMAVAVLRYYAGAADKIHGETIPVDGDVFTFTRKEPVGVVGQIIPWNFPFAMLSWKWGPALATGCTIVMKPSELTPLTATYMAALSLEAGFPPGVINIVHGYGPTVGAAISGHPDIAKVAFTGSSAVGKLILKAAADSNMKRVSLELGGKSPMVVFDDASDENLESFVDTCHLAVFANMGQCCTAGSRTFVQSGIYDRFVAKAKERAAKAVIGRFDEPGVNHGPQINMTQLNKVMDLIESGKAQGAKLEMGGARSGKKGYFVEPTIFSGVTDDMRIAKEEIFGPVQSIIKFETMEEVLERANDTTYGLAAGVCTSNINNAITFAQGIQAGTVWVNTYHHVKAQTPFGGFKQSGQGRELGMEGLHSYLENKTVTISIPKKNS